jgi:AcrR family transcriptional regulator
VPKPVDHQQRRELIARALWRVTARHGLDGVSIRHIAAEAGVSPGMVQHYFRTKDEMMTFSLDVISEHVRARLATHAEELTHGSPGTRVRTLLREMLPLDEQRRLEGHTAIALHAYAAVKPAITASRRDELTQLGSFLAEQLRVAQRDRHASAKLDPDHEAIALIALIEGLNILTLSGHCAPETISAVFDAHLRYLFGEPRLGRPT